MSATVHTVASSNQLAYAAVICNGDALDGKPTKAHSCGQVRLSEREYLRQMNRPDSLWMCPRCGSTADFDDEYFEDRHMTDETNHTGDSR